MTDEVTSLDAERRKKKSAQFVVRRDSGRLAPEEERELDAWLDDEENAESFARMEDALSVLDGADRNDPRMAALLEDARAQMAQGPRQGRLRVFAIAASIVLVLAFTLFFVGRGIPTDTPGDGLPGAEQSGSLAQAGEGGTAQVVADGDMIRTAVGEQRVITLSDGSVVTLNTATRIRVAMSQSRRLIWLDSGQALFDVAHDSSRPFVVRARDKEVIALGTVFEVSINAAQKVEVTLAEGRVVVNDVSRGDRAPEPISILEPGQHLVAASITSVPATVNVERQLMWRERLVEFNNERLVDAVAELNRYSKDKIRLKDSSAGNLRISGIYDVDDPAAFVSAVDAVLPLRGRKAESGVYEIGSPDAPAD